MNGMQLQLYVQPLEPDGILVDPGSARSDRQVCGCIQQTLLYKAPSAVAMCPSGCFQIQLSRSDFGDGGDRLPCQS
jgi:hypothetical protein